MNWTSHSFRLIGSYAEFNAGSTQSDTCPRLNKQNESAFLLNLIVPASPLSLVTLVNCTYKVDLLILAPTSMPMILPRN